MAKTPKLLDEALAALRAIKRLNIEDADDDEAEGDTQLRRAFKRMDRVLNKAAKLKAA
jgi:hypothetical protein